VLRGAWLYHDDAARLCVTGGAYGITPLRVQTSISCRASVEKNWPAWRAAATISALPPRWERTVITQRDAIAKLLRDSPSLRREVPAIIAAELPTARALALLPLAEHGETPGIDVARLQFKEHEVLGS
jgi:hypothetical protein